MSCLSQTILAIVFPRHHKKGPLFHDAKYHHHHHHHHPPGLTVSGLRDELSSSSDGLGEDSHDALPHTGDHPSGRAAGRAGQVPGPLEVLHGLVHDARNRP